MYVLADLGKPAIDLLSVPEVITSAMSWQILASSLLIFPL